MYSAAAAYNADSDAAYSYVEDTESLVDPNKVSFAFLSDGTSVVIKPFSSCDARIRADAIRALLQEWPAMSSLNFDDAYVTSRWSRGDVFYVMCCDGKHEDGDDHLDEQEHNYPSFLGCVGIDRERFLPFISHLLTHPDHRGKGVAAKLLQAADELVASMRFTEVRLWCASAMTDFYTRRGWELDTSHADNTQLVTMRPWAAAAQPTDVKNKNTDQCIMVKRLASTCTSDLLWSDF